MKKAYVLAVCIAVVLSVITGCGTTEPKVETKPVSGPLAVIKIAPENPGVYIGDEITLTAAGFDVSGLKVASFSPKWKVVKGSAKIGILYPPKKSGDTAIFQGKSKGKVVIEVSQDTINTRTTVIVDTPSVRALKGRK
jgi:hypothetical protein